MSLHHPQFWAAGTIRPCRAVKIEPTADHDFGVLEADANEWCVGISQEGTHDAPGLAGSSGNAAEDGDQITVHGDGEVCLWQKASTNINYGDLLVPDADGCAVPAASTGTTIQNVLAEALETSTVTGAKIRVRVVRFKFRPAVSE